MSKKFITLILIISISSVAIAEERWKTNYRKALNNLEKQDMISALYFIDAAINENDTPQLKVKEDDGTVFNYIPYYYMGIIYYRIGKYKLALSSFELSEKYGVTTEDNVLADNLSKYKLFVNNKLILKLSKEPADLPEDEQNKLEAQKKFFKDEYEAITDTDDDNDALRNENALRLIYAVRKEVLMPNEPVGIYPWYFYYERALKYIDEMQWKDAMIYLSEAILRKETPKQDARRYGVWFKDYTPYLYLAYTAWKQDLNAIASKAFEISTKFGVVKTGNPVYRILLKNIK